MKDEWTLSHLSRRRFLKLSATWTGGFWLVGIPVTLTADYKILTREESEIMDALADCIIPPGEFAGGKEAGLTHFIDQQIDDDGYLRRDRELYKTCLPALEQSSVERYGERFLRMGHTQQTDYLKRIEGGEYDDSSAAKAWLPFKPSHFFGKMRDHCMMGFYGSPEHGGNKNFVSYRMIRF